MATIRARRGFGFAVMLAAALACGIAPKATRAQDGAVKAEQPVPPTPPTPSTPPASPTVAKPDSRYIRTVDDAGGHRIVMQSAARTFVREGNNGQPTGPSVTMCAAVHIGDKPFYDNLQKLLDAKDVVLFESVKPAGTGRPEYDLALAGKEAEEHKVKTTKLRIRVLGIAAKSRKARQGAFAPTLDDLIAGLNPKMKPYVDGVTKDAWGNPLEYEVVTEAVEDRQDDGAVSKRTREFVEITSLGADGKVGGEGVDADLKLTDQKPIRNSELPRVETKGLQSQMAEGLGLVFQLDAMTHEHANWRNSDLSIDQVESRIAGAGGDANELFSTLDGSSIGAGLARILFGLMKMMPGFQLIGKVAMMEMLGRADELIDSVPGMEHMMGVIIKDRNEVVMDDLSRIIEKEKNVRTVGIIYGGGHMPDLEKRLAEMGYREQSVRWLDAIGVDLPKNKAEARQLERMRQMIRGALDEQVKVGGAAKKAKRKKAE